MHLIPAVKELTTLDGYLKNTSVCPRYSGDSRLEKALAQLPLDPQGTPLTLQVGSGTEEGYRLRIGEEEIAVSAPGPAGAFYAIQTLRQILAQGPVPCLEIRDCPDFPIRGFYHDETRGRINTVARVKALSDDMARFKLNSLQLYVEHVFEFRETAAITPHSGCYTKDELQELDEYCRERFIDFVPSLSTFGHMNDILNQPQYRHLQVLKDYKDIPNFWNARMGHHTIDPLEPESIQLISSLIDQYEPLFTSDTFNICCDETFDLKNHPRKDIDTGKMYVDFVKQIIAHTKSKGKKVMMWADILLQHPEVITDLPEDTVFLNWTYGPNPNEDWFSKFAELNRTQIVCPGTSTWSRLCENVDVEEQNISRMAEYGHRHGAVGVLNTNWGDWGNPCSLELAMYGLVLGAEKAWSVQTAVDAAFYARVNRLLYENENGIQYLKQLSRLHDPVKWNDFCRTYFEHRYGSGGEPQTPPADTAAVQRGYAELAQALSREHWTHDAYRQEMLLAAEGVCVIAELWDALLGRPGTRVTDTGRWLRRYEDAWLQKNQPNEFSRIRDMFEYCEAVSAASGT